MTTRRPITPVILALAFAVADAPAETARGVVFSDLNRDGIRQQSEPGIGGVRVSNGEDIVVTGNIGAYEIAIDDHDVLFVTKPPAYHVPVDDNQLPRFYYIHDPDGSPPHLRYPGVPPTGPLPDRIDFALIPGQAEPRFSALLFADPQPMSDREVDYIATDVITELLGTDAAFGMTLGDIMFDDLRLFPRYNALVGTLGIPWYNVPGNHELNFFAADDTHSLETFRRFYGPEYYSFEYGDAVFIVLDNIVYHGAGSAKPHDPTRRGKYTATLSERQLAWVANELELVPEGKLVVVATHAPLMSLFGEQHNGATTNRRALLELLSGREHLYAVAGHTHTTEHVYLGEEDGFAGPGRFHHHILATVSGSWWSGPADERGVPTTLQRDGTPNGYHIMDIDGTGVSVRYKAAGYGDDYQMRIMFSEAQNDSNARTVRASQPGTLFDGRVRHSALPGAEILVNLFDGGERSTVEARIGQREPLRLERSLRRDPVTHEDFLRHPGTMKEWVQATPSTHMFAAPLPGDLAPGTYPVSVRATNEFGRTHHAHALLEIE